MRKLIGIRFLAATSALTNLAALALSSPASADPSRGWGYGMMGDWDGSWGWGHAFFGPLIMILFWGGLIAIVVLGIRWLSDGGRGGGVPRKDALDILKERLARGEIDAKEFEEKKKLIS